MMFETKQTGLEMFLLLLLLGANLIDAASIENHRFKPAAVEEHIKLVQTIESVF